MVSESSVVVVGIVEIRVNEKVYKVYSCKWCCWWWHGSSSCSLASTTVNEIELAGVVVYPHSCLLDLCDVETNYASDVITTSVSILVTDIGLCVPYYNFGKTVRSDLGGREKRQSGPS